MRKLDKLCVNSTQNCLKVFKSNTKDIFIQINTKIKMCVLITITRDCDIFFTKQFWKNIPWLYFYGTILERCELFSEQFGCICAFVCTSTFCMVNRRKKINCVVVNVDSSPEKVVSLKGQIFDHL